MSVSVRVRPCVRVSVSKMKKHRLFLFLFLLLVHLLAAASSTVYLLQTTDIHAVLAKEEQWPGSWLKIASLIQEKRARFGSENCILLDCGDTIQGTLIGSLSRGEAATIPLKTLRYDAWIPGNHEFDFGFKRFLELAEGQREIILCGNLQPLQAAPFPAWKIFERGTARIALIGMTASYLKFWFGESFGDACRVDLAETSLQQIMPEILPLRPDMIVLAIHQAWTEGKDTRNVNEVNRLVEKFPEIDLILGGHTHRDMPGHKIGPRTWYLQAGYAAKSLGVVKAVLDTEKHELLEISSYLVNVQEETPDCPELLAALSPWLEKLALAKTQPIAPAPKQDILSKGRPGVNCQASELFCVAIAKAAGTSLALHGTLGKKSLLANKELTEQDLFEFVPYENTIVTAEVSASELCEIILEQWQNRDSYTFSGIYGCHVSVNQKGDKAEILDTYEKGARLSIAMNSFTAAGSGRYPKLKKILQKPETSTRDTGISTRDAVRDYLKQHPGASINATTWLKISNTRQSD